MLIKKEIPDRYLSLREQFLKQVNRESQILMFDKEELKLREMLKRKLDKGDLFWFFIPLFQDSTWFLPID